MNRKKVNFRRIIGSMLIVIFVLLTGCTRKEEDETLLTGESKEEKPEQNTIIVSEKKCITRLSFQIFFCYYSFVRGLKPHFFCAKKRHALMSLMHSPHYQFCQVHAYVFCGLRQ